MALVINSNIQSLNSQRQLDKSGMAQSEAMERLSSGKRINSAADDAAGLAIANRLTSQVRGLDRAISNAADGVSLIQTAEGALDESTNILQRMRELSIQSANGIYNDGDRATLDAEVQQLVEELDRIAETTSFNGQNILDGTLGETKLQVGSEANQTISFSIDAMDADTLGLGSTSSDLSGDRITTGANGDIADGGVQINGQGLAAITNLQGAAATDTTLQDVLDDINQNVDGVTAEGFNVVQAETVGSGVLDADDFLRITAGSADGSAAVIYDFTEPTSSLEELAAAINSKTGGAIDASIDDTGKLVLSNTTGGDITVALDGNGGGTFTAADTDTSTILGIADGADGETFAGQISLKSDDGSAISVTKGATGTDANLAVLGFRETSGAGEVLGSSLASGAQDDALAAGDLLINGVDIGAVSSVAGIGGKIDAINAVSDQTGVTASIEASESYTINTNGGVEIVATTFANAGAANEDIILNGVSVTVGSEATVAEVALAINGGSSSHGVTAFVDDDDELHIFSSSNITVADTGGGRIDDIFGANATSGSSHAVSAPASGSVSINNVEVTITDADDIDQVVTDINAVQGDTGVRASVDDNGELQLLGSSAINITLGTSGDSMKVAQALALTPLLTDTGGTADVLDETVTLSPRIKLDSANDQPISLEVKDAATTTATGFVDQNTDLSSTVTGSALSNISIGTQAGANDAIGAIDNALETISNTRSELGAVNNRLDFTMSNLANISEKTAASRSRIEDADFAAETANLSRAQVLQQAAQAMLAQANAAPQQVLSLLR
jgi:flagellin